MATTNWPCGHQITSKRRGKIHATATCCVCKQEGYVCRMHRSNCDLIDGALTPVADRLGAGSDGWFYLHPDCYSSAKKSWET